VNFVCATEADTERAGREIARSLAPDAVVVDPVLGVTAERALALGEVPLESEPLHPRAGDRLRVPRHERDVRALAQGRQRLRCARRVLPVGRVRIGQQLEIAVGDEPAPARKALVDVLVGDTRRLEHEPRNALRRLPGVVDLPDRVRREPKPPHVLDRVQRRPSDERVGGQKQRPVDVEEDEHARDAVPHDAAERRSHARTKRVAPASR
jgi:hypothetical protein